MPAVFLGHGNPMNALYNNAYTAAWAELGRSLLRPRAILAISAHWDTPAISVTANEHPPTIHDFGGFPPQLYKVQYPAPGDQGLAMRVQELLAPNVVRQDHAWGLDHGTWSVLCHVFPSADIPVVQLSIDSSRPPAFHYELGKKLTSLRDEGVLILGSGNIVHNLRAYAWGQEGAPAYPWAVRFENSFRGLLLEGDYASLMDYQKLGPDAKLAIPTPEHYLPLLYILGVQTEADALSFPVEGMEGGSISMLAVQVG